MCSAVFTERIANSQHCDYSRVSLFTLFDPKRNREKTKEPKTKKIKIKIRRRRRNIYAVSLALWGKREGSTFDHNISTIMKNRTLTIHNANT